MYKGSPLIGISRHRIGVDGEGVTTLVAFHNCSLNCKYCLNPNALKPDGVLHYYTAERLYDELNKDDLYFRATGGGVTFGGGEPLIESKEILHFSHICKEHGKMWKINIETSLNVKAEFVSVMSHIIDQWIVDIKDMNPDIYKAYTGEDNELVLQNLKYLISTGAKITVRVPLIPNFNTQEDVDRSIEQLNAMGITDIDKFTYTIIHH